MSKNKLTSRQESLLREALSRYIQFYSGWELTKAWTGLGYRSTYKPVLKAGLMEWCATGGPKSRYTGWLRLTESGAKIVQTWLDAWLDELDEEATDES